jgi:hypothetical protein
MGLPQSPDARGLFLQDAPHHLLAGDSDLSFGRLR